jgi:ketose-bisphosphate aldolase
MMDDARRGGYAIGYFESWSVDSLQGVIDAAEQTRSPVIIGFNGGFLSGTRRLTNERLAMYAALGKSAAESATVPCGLIFNECADDSWVQAAIQVGFNLVMPSDPSSPLQDYMSRVARLVRFAHSYRVAVEAESGEVPESIPGETRNEGCLTDPVAAERFVNTVGIDLLAVSVGNVHIKLEGRQGLDLQRLADIHRRVSIPLVLHGGTGIDSDALRQAISLGVTKVNFGTYLKQRYLTAVRPSIAREANPHDLLGRGGDQDVLIAGRHAVRDAVLERIGLLGCCGKA